MAKLNLGDTSVPFTLLGVDNQMYSLSDYANLVVVVIFSCNHCPYVRAWEDRMVQIQADYANQGVQFLVINANNAEKYVADSFPRMQERAIEKGFNFPYLYDETQEVARAYGAERTPEVFVFDQQGILRYHGTIDDNYDDPASVRRHYLREALDTVLLGSLPPTAETKPVGCTIKWR